MIKSTIVRDGYTIAFESESASDIATAISGVLSGQSQKDVVSVTDATATARRAYNRAWYLGNRKRLLEKQRKQKITKTVDAYEGEKKYVKTPWNKEDILAITRILVDVGKTVKATPRAYAYLKSHGKVRNRTYFAVQLMTGDVSKFLRKGTSFGKHAQSYLVAAGFNAKSLPFLGQDSGDSVVIPQTDLVREPIAA